MNYIKRISKGPTFKQKGFDGYDFNIENKEISITIEDSYKGHEKYHTNPRSTHIYYVIEGEGTFKIDGKLYKVKKDDCVEIPPNTEFIFAGKMKLLLVMNPAFNSEDGIEGKDNDIW